ncbi:hypothetical protein G4H71_02995 [Rhodococcus triatomae]|uniref:Excreted virulence factor EspC, type VII ESX diderm n=1 Tax=Rhodococcus triatomae TaxID=300028 RepID=A0A1G8M5A2_9NOCA|nr:hypothetical protein [Rhodococcus triatomae]QNG18191.1 hypothetical protein G4H72_05045 [Rhodococcus triatomae]QNG22138.1 hypothetical protein G4H71_02995 [Rhodococcus triatomae]SDI63075.1 hypothetical protein SAMN05444695_109109 [Rhodococcus triatomae]
MDVDAAELDVFAARLDDLAGQAAEAVRYLEEHLSIGMGDARIFATVAPAVADTRTQLVDNTNEIKRLIEESGKEMAKVADHYRTTDRVTTSNLAQIQPG